MPPLRPRLSGQDSLLREDVVRILSTLSATHPARVAFDEGERPTGLLRLLQGDTKAYGDLIQAIIDWNNRVLCRTSR